MTGQHPSDIARTIDFQPLGRRVTAPAGMSLLEAAREGGVQLNALCGGDGCCGKCRVRVVEGEVSSLSTSEPPDEDGLCLACQTVVTSDVKIEVPAESISTPQRIQLEGLQHPPPLDPPLQLVDLSVPPASADDLSSDELRLRAALAEKGHLDHVQIDLEVMVQLPSLLRQHDGSVRLFLQQDELLGAAAPGAAALGLAVDVGTTKIATSLVDLDSGASLATAGAMNPHIIHGEDVVTRIAHAAGAGHLQALQRSLAKALDQLVDVLCQRSGHSREEIREAVMVGNTCNHHLLLGLPVAQLGAAPYVPALSSSCDIKARDLGLELAQGATVHLLPNIAGFVGADHVAMILAAGIHQSDEITLGLDIGTNTEVVLTVGDRLLSCSTASGPAFEGAHISQGMRAAPGAIERVQIDESGRIDLQTIGDQPPVGLCGSGVVDTVAELRRVRVLEDSGAMRPGSHPSLHGEGAEAEFILATAGVHDAPSNVALTRRDVNEIQLAKGAIRAGIEVLLDTAGVSPDQVERVVMAGAFGTYLDVDSALGLGLTPEMDRSRFESIGNAAGSGAHLALVSRERREQAAAIAEQVEYVELTSHADFFDIYTTAMMLP